MSILTLAFLIEITQALTIDQFRAEMTNHLRKVDKQTIAGVHIVSLADGVEIFSHEAETQLVPASASKLITTIAAFENLGIDKTLQTRAILEGEDLVLQGQGDPDFLSEDLWALAQRVSQQGFEHFRSIIIDNSYFGLDFNYLHDFPGSERDASSGIISATNLNFNVAQFIVSPDRTSGVPNVEVGPRDNHYGLVINHLKQVKGSTYDVNVISLGVENHREKFELTGTVGTQSGVNYEYLPVKDPDAHTAEAAAGILRSLGVTVDQAYGGTRFDSNLNQGHTLATFIGKSLHQLAGLYLPPSHNFMAEQVFMQLGSDSTKGNSLDRSRVVINHFLRTTPGCESSSMVNGSGLTFANRVSARCFTMIIRGSLASEEIFNALFQSLPIGGQSGTLRHRFKGLGGHFRPENVRAKTGTLWSEGVATSLVGFTFARGDKLLAFSLVENDERKDRSLLHKLKSWEDQAVYLMQQLVLN